MILICDLEFGICNLTVSIIYYLLSIISIMRIALIGYGKMGKAIEEIALAKGHSIVLKIDEDNKDEFTLQAHSIILLNALSLVYLWSQALQAGPRN